MKADAQWHLKQYNSFQIYSGIKLGKSLEKELITWIYYQKWTAK